MRKVVIVGTGFVGMSYAYAQLNQGGISELVLIDRNIEKAEGEALDLNHGLSLTQDKMSIYAGEYKDCKDADIVIITAGTAQKEGETRIDLLSRNANIMKEITKSVVSSGFKGIFLIASNPVDIMSTVVLKESGFPKNKVIGSGTVLDTSRLRYKIAEQIKIDSRNVHGYVLGEHGDTEFIPWSQVYIGVKKLSDVIKTSKYIKESDFPIIEDEVKNSAYKIIKAKNSTYYGIGIALVRIVKAILDDERSILPVSSYFEGEYGIDGIHAGIPSLVTKDGIEKIVDIFLEEKELQKLKHSTDTLKENLNSLK